MKTALLTAVGVVLFSLALWHRPPDADDFVPFYRAASLISLSSCPCDVYASPNWSPKTNAPDRFLPYLRIPSYALATWPLARLPYAVARNLWIAGLAIAIIGCVALFPAARSALLVALAFSFPLADALMVGQDISFVLLTALFAAWVFSRGWEFVAGLAASLLAIKLTFLPAAGIIFVGRSKRAFGGLVTGVFLQLVLSFTVGGLQWPSEYLAILRNPQLDVDPRGMLNIHALSLPIPVYLTAAAAIYIAGWLICRRLNITDGMIVAMAFSLIASPHGLVYDGVMLAPLLVRVASWKSITGWLGYLALTPIIYLMVLMGNAPIMLAGSSLIVFITAAAAIKLYRRAAI